ncbi:hypothetical protein BaRGS_00006406 [Batillaria attramentaria]|uniref:Uncharacterized protein n=1 Tax=Batillaria attramentaria TaxID=370345 RepID=A0ABD0LTF2_9CAEN
MTSGHWDFMLACLNIQSDEELMKFILTYCMFRMTRAEYGGPILKPVSPLTPTSRRANPRPKILGRQLCRICSYKLTNGTCSGTTLNDSRKRCVSHSSAFNGTVFMSTSSVCQCINILGVGDLSSACTS